jgi:hypothetical protein
MAPDCLKWLNVTDVVVSSCWYRGALGLVP